MHKCPETAKKRALKRQPTMGKQEKEEGQKNPDEHFGDLEFPLKTSGFLYKCSNPEDSGGDMWSMYQK